MDEHHGAPFQVFMVYDEDMQYAQEMADKANLCADQNMDEFDKWTYI